MPRPQSGDGAPVFGEGSSTGAPEYRGGSVPASPDSSKVCRVLEKTGSPSRVGSEGPNGGLRQESKAWRVT